MIWIPVVLAAMALAVLAIALYGSDIIFHPPNMLPMEIWPDHYGFSYETVQFETPDRLTLTGWLIPSAIPTDRTILLCHGWGDNKGDLLQHTYFLQKNFNMFFLDFRHHGESEGCLSTIGCFETRDIEAAMEFLKNKRPEWARRMGVFGLSMGAGLAIATAERYPMIKAVAVESPFASFKQVVTQWVANHFHLPYFPVAWATLAVFRKRIGMDPEPCSPIYHVAGIAPRPILFIAGDQDKLMPLSVVRSVYETAGNPKELWIVAEAGHGQCEEVAGTEYHRHLTDFFDKNI